MVSNNAGNAATQLRAATAACSQLRKMPPHEEATSGDPAANAINNLFAQQPIAMSRIPRQVLPRLFFSHSKAEIPKDVEPTALEKKASSHGLVVLTLATIPLNRAYVCLLACFGGHVCTTSHHSSSCFLCPVLAVGATNCLNSRPAAESTLPTMYDQTSSKHEMLYDIASSLLSVGNLVRV